MFCRLRKFEIHANKFESRHTFIWSLELQQTQDILCGQVFNFHRKKKSLMSFDDCSQKILITCVSQASTIKNSVENWSEISWGIIKRLKLETFGLSALKDNKFYCDFNRMGGSSYDHWVSLTSYRNLVYAQKGALISSCWFWIVYEFYLIQIVLKREKSWGLKGDFQKLSNPLFLT